MLFRSISFFHSQNVFLYDLYLSHMLKFHLQCIIDSLHSRKNKSDLVSAYSNPIGDEGGHQGGIVVNSDGFLRHRARGVSTPDLVVTEFQMGCRQMDLTSACVLRPLNCLVLYFKTRGGGVMG